MSTTLDWLYEQIKKADEQEDIPEQDRQRIRMIGTIRILKHQLEQLEAMLLSEIETDV